MRERIACWLCVAAVCAAAVAVTGLQSRHHLALAAAGPRADELVNGGRLADAEALLRRALEAEPESFDLRDRLADVLLSTGRRDEALKERREALRRNPEMPEAYQALADTCDVLSRYEEASATMERYLARWPDDPRGLHVLAYCSERAGRPRLALDAWRRLLRIVPGHLSAQRGAARLATRLEGEDEPAPEDSGAEMPRLTRPLPVEPDLSNEERWM